MSTLPQRNTGVFITIGLAVVGAIVAGVILFTSGKASDVELTTARLVPDDASLYVAFNTDLSSDQWVSTFKLLERLGEDDPKGQLEDSVDEAGQDWEKDVVPFLGGDAAFFLRSANISLDSVDGAVVFRAKDPEAALTVIKEQSGITFTSDTYEGTKYWASDDDSFTRLFAVIIDKHVALASEEDVLFDVIDTAKGRRENLTSVQDFKTLRDELTKNFLAFWYIDSQALFSDFLDSDDGIMRTALEEAGIADIALKPSAFAFGANKNGFEGQSASLGEPGAIGPATTPAESRFAKLVPADTAIFFSTHGLAETYEQIVAQSGEDMDRAIRDASEYDSLDDALEAAGREIGIDSVEEIIAQLTGETAGAFWFPEDSTDDAHGAILAEVADEAEARRILDDIVAANATSAPRESQVNGVDVVTITDEDGDDVSWAITDGYLIFGTPDALEAILDPQGARLADSEHYKTTVEAMPTKLGTYVYFDLATLLRLPEAGIVPQLDDAEAALKGAILNYVNERDVVRSSGVITIKE